MKEMSILCHCSIWNLALKTGIRISFPAATKPQKKKTEIRVIRAEILLFGVLFIGLRRNKKKQYSTLEKEKNKKEIHPSFTSKSYLILNYPKSKQNLIAKKAYIK